MSVCSPPSGVQGLAGLTLRHSSRLSLQVQRVLPEAPPRASCPTLAGQSPGHRAEQRSFWGVRMGQVSGLSRKALVQQAAQGAAWGLR